MMDLPCNKEALCPYIPHKGRMLLLDQLDGYSLEKGSLCSSVFLSENSEFLDKKNQRLPAWVSFEYMAQSIALLSGLKAADSGEPPNTGFILAVRDCQLDFPWFRLGDHVAVEVRQEYREGSVAVFHGTASVNSRCHAKAVLNVIENTEGLLDSRN